MRVSAAKDPFVQDTEKRIENRRRPLKDFIQESDLSLRQHSANVCFHRALTQFAKAYWAKDLVRLCKSAQQVLEIPSPGGLGNPAHRNAFRGSWRSNYE